MKTKKAMKKITIIGMAALVAMGMLGTSCNKAESPEIETPETQKENIVTWVKAVSNALEPGDIADGSKSATFTFTLTNPDKTQNVDYIYPAAIVNQSGNMNEAALFGSQDGTLNTNHQQHHGPDPERRHQNLQRQPLGSSRPHLRRHLPHSGCHHHGYRHRRHEELHQDADRQDLRKRQRLSCKLEDGGGLQAALCRHNV